MSRFLFVALLALTVAQCYGAPQVQMPETAELQQTDEDLQSQVRDLQKNVSDIWTYIYELRSAVSNHLNHLRQHQVSLETSMHKMEHLHESELQSSGYHHGDEHHSHSGEQHSHGGADHSHSGEHHSHGGADHSHSGEHHSHGGADHSHNGEHHSHGGADHSHSGEHHSHSSEHHSHSGEHGHSSYSHSHSHSAHDHGKEDGSHSHGDDDHHHHHGQTDSHETEDFQQQTQQSVGPPPVPEPVVVATDRREHHHSHHHHSSHSSRSGNADEMNLMNENNFHRHHHHHHDSDSSKRNRTVELPKYSDYGLYDLAVCDVVPNRAIPEEQQQNVVGTVTLWQKKSGGQLNLHVQLQGFNVDGHHEHHQSVQQEENNETPQVGHKHGFHIHTNGDLSNGCQSTGPHFNPKGTKHGGPNSLVRHVGDLGMISCDDHGNTNIVFSDDVASLRGPYSILGKSMVIHSLEDDFGLGGNDESLKTGNAGTRIACCVIRRVEKIPIRQHRVMKDAVQRQNR